jgi:hypothetical protein
MLTLEERRAAAIKFLRRLKDDPFIAEGGVAVGPAAPSGGGGGAAAIIVSGGAGGGGGASSSGSTSFSGLGLAQAVTSGLYCSGTPGSIRRTKAHTPRLYGMVTPIDFSGTQAAHVNIDAAAWANFAGWLTTHLDPILNAGIADVLLMRLFGNFATPYSAGTCVDGTTANINPANQVNHESTVAAGGDGGGREYLDQIGPAIATRRARIDNLLVYQGPLHASSGVTNAELDAFTEVVRAINAKPIYDVQSAIDYTLFPPHRFAVLRYLLVTAKKVGGEPRRGTQAQDAKATGWDAMTDTCLSDISFMEAVYGSGNGRDLFTSLRRGDREIVLMDGSRNQAAMLAGIALWMGRGYDVACEMGGKTAGELAALRSAADAAAAAYVGTVPEPTGDGK